MGEAADDLIENMIEKGVDKRARIEKAKLDFWDAQNAAKQHGFELIQRSESHYQIRGHGWLYNVYPGNQRIYRDRKYKNGWLSVPTPWTLLDVVEAGTELLKESEAE